MEDTLNSYLIPELTHLVVEYVSDYLICASNTNILVYSTSTSSLIRKLSTKSRIRQMLLVPNRRFITIGTEINRWDINTWKLIKSYDLYVNKILVGENLYCLLDSSVEVRDITSSDLIRTIKIFDYDQDLSPFIHHGVLWFRKNSSLYAFELSLGTLLQKIGNYSYSYGPTISSGDTIYSVTEMTKILVGQTKIETNIIIDDIALSKDQLSLYFRGEGSLYKLILSDGSIVKLSDNIKSLNMVEDTVGNIYLLDGSIKVIGPNQTFSVVRPVSYSKESNMLIVSE